MTVAQDALARVSLSRRQLLRASGASAIIAVSYWGDDRTRSEQPQGSAALVAATAFNRRTLTFFSGDYAILRTWDLATAVEISRIGPTVEHIQVVVRSDARLVAPREVLIVESANGYHQLDTNEFTTEGTAVIAKYTIDAKVWQQHRLRFGPPLVIKSLYPNDAYDDAVVPTVEITTVDGRGRSQSLTRALATATERPVQPWSAEVTASWGIVSRTADGNEFYRAPGTILLTSVGPNPAPAGLQFEIRVAESATATPAISGYADGAAQLPVELITSSVMSDGVVRSIVLSITESLAPGAQRSITLAWPEFEVGVGALAPPRGVVRLITTGDESAPRRGPSGVDSIVDTAAAPAEIKHDLAKKGG